jgi:hypothetical protein
MLIKKFILTLLPLIQFPLALAAQDIDDETASTIIGGATVDITNLSPDASLVRDQIYVRATISHALAPGSVTVDQNTGNGKAWSTLISTRPSNNQEYGSWISNMNYPLTNNRGTFSVRVCNRNIGEGTNGVPCSIIPNGDAALANIGLDPRLRVVKVWFHTVKDNNEAAAPDTTRTINLVDWIANADTNIVEPNGPPEGALNADYVLAGCNARHRIQFRYHNHDIVDATNWTPTSFNFTRFWPAYTTVDGYTNSLPHQFANYVKKIDPAKQYLHVFFVNQMYYYSNRTGRIIGRANGTLNNDVSLIAIEDDAFNEMSFRNAARLLVHEFGHETNLGHYYKPEECNGTSNSNVMCPIIGGSNGAGDQWGTNRTAFGDSSQCSDMHLRHTKYFKNQYR